MPNIAPLSCLPPAEKGLGRLDRTSRALQVNFRVGPVVSQPGPQEPDVSD